MLLLGILSVLQISFLPGYILSRPFNFERLASKILFIFCISLLFNFQFVFLITALGLYSRYAVSVLVLIECGTLIYFHYKDLVSVKKFKSSDLWSGLGDIRLSWPRVVLLFLFFVAVVQLLILSFESSPIFSLGDSVVSWNRWAVDWAQNKLPVMTWLYPQLLPANWSISYLLIGDVEINFFAKFVMYFFPFGIMLIFWDLFLQTKRLVFILSGVFTVFMLFAIQRNFIFSGYVDIPLAFFCLTVFYFLYLTIQRVFPVKEGLIISAAILSGASLTKQPGLFMIFPFLIFGLTLWKKYRSIIGRPYHLILTLSLVGAVCILPWYVYKQVQIHNSKESSNVSFLISNERHHGIGYFERLQNGTMTILNQCVGTLQSTNIPFTSLVSAKHLGALIFLFLAISLFDPVGRISFLLIGLPYYIIWGMLFSYDLRNVSLSIPFLSIGLAAGIVYFYAAATTVIKRFYPQVSDGLLLKIGLAVGFVFFAAGSFFKWNRNFFYKEQVALSMEQLGPSDLNNKLYNLLDSVGTQGMVVSNYWFLPHLPRVNKFSFQLSFEDSVHTDSLERLILRKPESQPMRYILVSRFLAHASALKTITGYEQSGILKNVFQQSYENGGWTIYEYQRADIQQMLEKIQSRSLEVAGQQELNLMLYNFYHENGLNGKIASNYFSYSSLPLINGAFESFNFMGSSVDDLRRFLNVNKKRIRYLLISKFVSSNDIQDYINEQTHIKSIVPLFSTSDPEGGWTFYQIEG